jgi:hypothetical protein
MTSPQTDQVQVQQQQQNDREINFRKQEMMFQRQLAAEKARSDDLERRYEESRRQIQQTSNDDDDDTSDPYVDHKKLEKKLAKHGQQVKQETQTEIQKAVNLALAEERKSKWLKEHGDFVAVMQLADKFHAQHTDLAESILEMPEGFERQKLVYKNIKSLGLDKPEVAQPTIQQKIDANRKGPFYQPSGVGTNPYSSQGNFSPSGQKEAYDKMQELKARLRI